MSEAEKVLIEIEKMSTRKFFPIVGPRKGRILVDIIHEIRPKRILEVGTFIGYSAILMGKELDSDVHLITIEIHSDETKMAEENIKRSEILPKIDVLIGDAIEMLPKLEGKFDLVFLDADKSEYPIYLRLVEDKLHKGSIIVADNAGIFEEDMKDYLNQVRSSGKYDSKYIPVEEDGVEISTKL